MQPRVLLLDEPFGAWIPAFAKDMHALLLQLIEQTRMTVFMVTRRRKASTRHGLLVFDKVRIDRRRPTHGERVLPTTSRSMKRGWRNLVPSSDLQRLRIGR